MVPISCERMSSLAIKGSLVSSVIVRVDFLVILFIFILHNNWFFVTEGTWSVCSLYELYILAKPHGQRHSSALKLLQIFQARLNP